MRSIISHSTLWNRLKSAGDTLSLVVPNLLLFHASMKEYQAVVVKLTRHTREDEDTLTDLLNERSRGGWEPALMSQDEQRLIVLFQRTAVAEG